MAETWQAHLRWRGALLLLKRPGGVLSGDLFTAALLAYGPTFQPDHRDDLGQALLDLNCTGSTTGRHTGGLNWADPVGQGSPVTGSGTGKGT